MVFSSLSFIFAFLPIFLALYYCVPFKYKNVLLFVGSLVFYSFGEPVYLFLILASTLANYALGLGIARCERGKNGRTLLFLLALTLDFGVLIIFKYADFFIENLNLLLGLFQTDWRFNTLNLPLPLGISFYTFQIASYIIDVYTGKVKAEKSYINIGAYVCMFPQLIAGPIVIYSEIADSLRARTLSVRNFDSGLKTFIVGLGFKVIIANQLSTLWNEICTIGFESISMPLAWLGAASYSLELYFDFCGYSYMAVGLGRILGFELPRNFDSPYMSRSVTEFWRRWHITLGRWFRAYVYIPLGGNRRGKARTMLNLFTVWLLVGFWHGAAWNFILWGILIFILLAVEKKWTLKRLNADTIFAKAVSHIYILLYIAVSWVIFAVTDFTQLGVYLSKMFSPVGFLSADMSDFWRLLGTYSPFLIAGALLSTNYPKRLWARVRNNALGITAAVLVFWYSVYLLAIGMNNPFLYFRF